MGQHAETNQWLVYGKPRPTPSFTYISAGSRFSQYARNARWASSICARGCAHVMDLAKHRGMEILCPLRPQSNFIASAHLLWVGVAGVDANRGVLKPLGQKPAHLLPVKRRRVCIKAMLVRVNTSDLLHCVDGVSVTQVNNGRLLGHWSVLILCRTSSYSRRYHAYTQTDRRMMDSLWSKQYKLRWHTGLVPAGIEFATVDRVAVFHGVVVDDRVHNDVSGLRPIKEGK